MRYPVRDWDGKYVLGMAIDARTCYALSDGVAGVHSWGAEQSLIGPVILRADMRDCPIQRGIPSGVASQVLQPEWIKITRHWPRIWGDSRIAPRVRRLFLAPGRL